MKKAVLFIGYDSHTEEEIREYIHDKSTMAFFSHTNDESIHILEGLAIKKVVLNLRSLKDAIILRYVNRYFPEIEVVVSATKEFDEVISIFNQTNFSRLPSPFRLEELGGKL